MQGFKVVEVKGIPQISPTATVTGIRSHTGIHKTRTAKPTDLVVTGFRKDGRTQEAVTVNPTHDTVNTALCTVKIFIAGNIAHITDWRSIISDSSILEIVSGYHIDFEGYQSFVPNIKSF